MRNGSSKEKLINPATGEFKIFVTIKIKKIMEKLLTHTYHIGGMSCGGCVSAVKQKLSSVPGVTSVTVDLGKKEAEITSSEEIQTGTLQHAFGNTHYTISELNGK
jgi:copper chaperone